MCNLSTGILERGIQRGMEQGIEKGREEGMMETLFSLVRKGLLTIVDAAKQAEMDPYTFKRKYESYCSK